MIRSVVGKHRVWSGTLAGLVGVALLVLACETPMPPEGAKPEVAAQLWTDLNLEGSVGLLTGPDVGLAVDRLTGEKANDPLVYIDGVRLSDPVFLQTVEKSWIERIEVIKGNAATTLYGEEAANGIMQVFLTEAGRESIQSRAGPIAPGEAGEADGGPGDGRRILLRGTKAVDQEAAEPLVFIDGVRMEGEAGTDAGLAGIDPDDIERIEVIKKDEAVARYGPDAAAGVILIFTKKK